jgi:ribulose-5-phosphate 4-epimerase/fuculose-1-phosphate aldolase
MFFEQLKGLEEISQAVGNRSDYVQGGGGNTSLKLDDRYMAVKASGYKISDVTAENGFVVVNYNNIKQYHENVNLSEDRDYGKESSDYVRANIVQIEGLKALRPSVEAGFHSLLQKYVIHTHPVYTNLLCCSNKGHKIAETIFNDAGHGFVWIPYISPGFMLTIAMREEIKQYVEMHNSFPQVFFLENHGLVVTSETVSECIKLHNSVNDTIRRYFKIDEEYPPVGIMPREDGTYISKTDYLKDYFKHNQVSAELFEENVLYPDQLVYLNGNISINEKTNKLSINTNTGEIVYRTNEEEAYTMEEILTAFVFILENVRKNNLEEKALNKNQTDFIKNWDGEKYRKSILYKDA